MFQPEDRDRLRETLIAEAQADPRIVSAALIGSAALGSEDRWSDIDLAFGIAEGADCGEVIRDWTERMVHAGAVHHLDMPWGDALFRVFFLANTLQVDLAFWPADQFAAIGPAFCLLFGTASERPVPSPEAVQLIGMGWLYALHARSSIERGRVWQAEYMLSGMRDHVLALACLRHGVPAVQGRGFDNLPPEAIEAVAGSLIRPLDFGELRRAFRVLTEALISEIELVDAGLGGRLNGPLRSLVG